MPIGIGGAAAITAGSTLFGQGANAYAQGKTNRKTRLHNAQMAAAQSQGQYNAWNMQNQYNEGLWNKQNQYNERMWHMMNQYGEDRWRIENEYNSPAAQMARYKEAGLNPFLIYGQSNMGGHVSTANLDTPMQRSDGAPKTAAQQSWNPRAPQFDMNNGIMAFNAFRESAARTNNLEAQNELIKMDTAMRGAQIANEVVKTNKNQIDVDRSSALYQTSLDAAELGLRKQQMELNLGEQQLGIRDIKGKGYELDNIIKKLEMDLMETGVSRSDPWYMRVLVRLLQEYGIVDLMKK